MSKGTPPDGVPFCYIWLRSRSQLGMGRALTLETMPIAANRVMMDDPP